MERELENLRAAIVKAFLNSDNIDLPYLRIGTEKFTRRQLATEIENKTEKGNSFVKDMLLLATDLALREKREITQK